MTVHHIHLLLRTWIQSLCLNGIVCFQPYISQGCGIIWKTQAFCINPGRKIFIILYLILFLWYNSAWLRIGIFNEFKWLVQLDRKLWNCLCIQKPTMTWEKELHWHCQFQQKIWINSINRHVFVCPANERVRAKTMQKVINGINKKLLLTRINSYPTHI